MNIIYVNWDDEEGKLKVTPNVELIGGRKGKWRDGSATDPLEVT